MLPSLELVQTLVGGMDGVKSLRTIKLRPRKGNRDFLFHIEFSFQHGETSKGAKQRFRNFFKEQGWECKYCEVYNQKDLPLHADVELVIANPD